MKRYALLFLTSLSFSLFANAATTIVRGPYLQLATPTSMVVRWRTDTTESSLVNYGITTDQLTLTAKAQGITTEHIVQLSGLKPATRYYYTVGAGTEKNEAGEDTPSQSGISTFTTRCGAIRPCWITARSTLPSRNSIVRK